MSLPFRIFLLILFGFGAIWLYRFRAPEIQDWLRPGRAPRDLAAAGSARPRAGEALISPVDGVLAADGRLRLRILGKEPAPRGERGSAAASEAGALALSEEEMALAADLPLLDGVPDVESPDAGLQPHPDSEPPAASRQPPVAPSVPQPPDDGTDGDSLTAGESPAPSPQPPAEPAPDPRSIIAFDEIAYRVEAGDNLWRIAERFLGSGKRFAEIRDWNRDLFRRVNPEAVPVGAILKVRVPAGSGAGTELKPGPAPVDKPVERDPAPRKPKQKRPSR
jgi:hypothetical protein